MSTNRSILLLAACAGFVSCTPYQQQGGMMGGLAGAGLGAIFGDDHQDAVAGAAVGAALGAGAAAVHEDQVRRRQYADSQYDRYGIPPQQQAPPPGYRQAPPPPTGSQYPLARRADEPGQVVSPFPPYRKIDVTGFRSGQLAKDPTTGQIFRIP